MRHIDLRAEHLLAVGISALFHLTEQLQVLLDAPVAVRTVHARLVHGAAVCGDFLLGFVIHIGETALDKLLGPLVELVEVVRCVALLLPLEAEPLDVFLDGINIFGVLLGRIGVVVAQVGLATVLLGKSEIYAKALGVSKMEISVRFRREAGKNGAYFSGFQVIFNNLFEKIELLYFFFHKAGLIKSDKYSIFAAVFNTLAMVKSMTGYGKAVANLENGNLTVEIRTLNSKNADINLKSSLLPKDKELGIRTKISGALQRGTIDVFLTWEPNAAENAKLVNMALAKEYFRQISELGAEIGARNLMLDNPNELLANILRMPDVIDARKQDVITEENWPSVEAAFDRCLEAVNLYRAHEGEVLYRDVTSRVHKIEAIYDEVETLIPERVAAVRERILKAAEELSLKLDGERLEQEMIFYLEKLDINEERVRLRQHCKYFMDTIDGEPYPGKKLGFIIQEMGREINTTGSKANHAGIQNCVVRMKDELEKIREQSMNIL